MIGLNLIRLEMIELKQIGLGVIWSEWVKMIRLEVIRFEIIGLDSIWLEMIAG